MSLMPDGAGGTGVAKAPSLPELPPASPFSLNM